MLKGIDLKKVLTCEQVQIGAVPLIKEEEVSLALHDDVPGVD